ncbi:MAG: hypothetical protein Q9187_006780 [Circinaria calcarea]
MAESKPLAITINTDGSTHIKDDTIRAFNEIHSSSQRMRQQMVDIAQHAFKRAQAQDWATQMRFLVIREPSDRIERPTTLKGRETSEQSDTSQGPLTSVMRNLTLELASASALVAGSAYVAVSYCWNREEVDWFTDQKTLRIDVVRPGDDSSPSMVPLDVLHRSVTHAIQQGVNAVWIDQECINQKDDDQKEAAIQVMDIVYQKAAHAIAVLETYLETEAEITALASVFDEDDYPFNPTQMEVLADVLTDLCNDAWFSRAWTLQEATSAGVTMVLLIGCNPNVSKPAFFGTTPGEIAISIWDFQQAMVIVRNIIEDCLATGLCANESTAIQASNCAEVLYNYVPTIYPESRIKDTSHRQTCSAAEAFTFLDDRENSHFPDRLAILGNLCNYEKRLKSCVLDVPSHAFTTCALVLATINGDMSLLVGYGGNVISARDKNSPGAWVFDLARDGRSHLDVFVNDDSDSCSINYGFSWGPKPTGRLHDIQYFDDNGHGYRLTPATISENGWKIRGVVWHMVYSIAVPQTQNSITARWMQELETQRVKMWDIHQATKRSELLAQDFIWTLLHDLVKLGYYHLPKTLWNFFQPWGKTDYGLDSYEAPIPYPFEQVFGRSAEGKEQGKLFEIGEDEYIKSHLRVGTLLVDVESEVYRTPSSTRVLIEQISQTGSIICGAQLKSSGCSEPRVFFDGCKQGDLVFTPFTAPGDGAARSLYGAQAMSWKVSRTGKIAEECEILHCFGRRSGFWRMDDLVHTNYILE